MGPRKSLACCLHEFYRTFSKHKMFLLNINKRIFQESMNREYIIVLIMELV